MLVLIEGKNSFKLTVEQLKQYQQTGILEYQSRTAIFTKESDSPIEKVKLKRSPRTNLSGLTEAEKILHRKQKDKEIRLRHKMACQEYSNFLKGDK